MFSLACRPAEGLGLSAFRNDLNVLSIFTIHLSLSIGLMMEGDEFYVPASVYRGDCQVGALETGPETRLISKLSVRDQHL